jgi:hypothetical protein
VWSGPKLHSHERWLYVRSGDTAHTRIYVDGVQRAAAAVNRNPHSAVVRGRTALHVGYATAHFPAAEWAQDGSIDGEGTVWGDSGSKVLVGRAALVGQLANVSYWTEVSVGSLCQLSVRWAC